MDPGGVKKEGKVEEEAGEEEGEKKEEEEEDEEEITAETLRANPDLCPSQRYQLSATSRRGTRAPRSSATSVARARTGVVSLYDCEQERTVPVLMSSVYGKRINQPVEPLNRDYIRVNHVKTDFYRKNDIASMKGPSFGHITPA
ncbi:Uncharacterized protein C5orf49 homolog [Apodemus speciosus]|uniref:Uncharacterized protein C5orf49 homolog n=1 Tax=Apodemus speciosus TaxID=105296 RepID=A0ABQ0FGH3_APOSI